MDESHRMCSPLITVLDSKLDIKMDRVLPEFISQPTAKAIEAIYAYGPLAEKTVVLGKCLERKYEISEKMHEESNFFPILQYLLSSLLRWRVLQNRLVLTWRH
jgi:hypothetical protein